MPEPGGKLTPDEQQRALRWLGLQWRTRVCPVSGHTKWEVGEYMVQTLPYAGGNLLVGGASYPLIVITCAICGYTFFINAIRAGVLPAQPIPSAAQPPPVSSPPRTPDV